MLERYVLMRGVDRNWQQHLTEMEELRRSVGLRGYGQKDPLMEYKSEAYKFFEELMDSIRRDICTGLFRSASNIKAFENMLANLARNARVQGPNSETQTGSGSGVAAAAGSWGGRRNVKLPKVTVKRDVPKVGRNEPCPCGSGKKYKKCCGALQTSV